MEKRVGVLRGAFNALMRLCVVHMFMSAIHLHNSMHDTQAAYTSSLRPHTLVAEDLIH
jgi:hypothetical protein